MDESKFKSYVATKLATDPNFAQTHFKTDAEGNKINTFSPEMFAAVKGFGDETQGGCTCYEDEAHGHGSSCGDKGGTHCTEEEGHTHRP